MADLLECLIQIKGLADTPRRLSLLLSRTGALAGSRASRSTVARWMAESEARFARCLALMLEEESPRLPALPAVADRARLRNAPERMSPGGEGKERPDWELIFANARAQTVATLDRCSAEQLSRLGIEPSRGPVTVADLVALMLSHDTDCLGELANQGPGTRRQG